MALLDGSCAPLRPADPFLTRVVTAMLFVIAISMLGLRFPLEPAREALTCLTAGIPSFFLTHFHTRVLERMDTYRIPAPVVERFEAFGGLTYTLDEAFGTAAATAVVQYVARFAVGPGAGVSPGLAIALWILVQRTAWRASLLDRLLTC